MRILRLACIASSLVVVIGTLAACSRDPTESPTESTTSIRSDVSTPTGLRIHADPTVGELMEVADLNLTILAVEPFNPTTYEIDSEANVLAEFTVTNARGADDHPFNPAAEIRLIEGPEIAHSPH